MTKDPLAQLCGYLQTLPPGPVGDEEKSEVVMDEALAQSWIAQAQQIPGWQDGPDYAPHPIVAQALEPDDPTG